MERLIPSVKITSPEKRARVGERIKIAATSSGITLKELARLVNCSPALIYQYVRGITNVPQPILAAIATVTHVDLDFFNPDKEPRGTTGSDMKAYDGPDGKGVSRAAGDLVYLQGVADAFDEPRRNSLARITTLHEMLAISRVIGDRKQEADAQCEIGVLKSESGDIADAKARLSQAHEIYTAIGLDDRKMFAEYHIARICLDTVGAPATIARLEAVASSNDSHIQWRAYVDIARTHICQAAYTEAFAALSQAANHHESMPDGSEKREAQAVIESQIARIVRDSGHYNAALEIWNRVIDETSAAKNVLLYVRSLVNKAECLRMAGRPCESMPLLNIALSVANFTLDNHSHLYLIRAQMARVQCDLNQQESAKENARLALRLSTKLGNRRDQVKAVMALSEAYTCAGQYEDALSCIDEAITDITRYSLGLIHAQAINIRARALMERGARNDDADGLRDALEEARRSYKMSSATGVRRDVVASKLIISKCLTLLGDRDRAKKVLSAVFDILKTNSLKLGIKCEQEELGTVPKILKSLPVNLCTVFSDPAMQMPLYALQAHDLKLGLLDDYPSSDRFGIIADAVSSFIETLQGITACDREYIRNTYPALGSRCLSLIELASNDSERQLAESLYARAVEMGYVRCASK